jgi:septal ring factor EnvC (AmiA/AmiB activator)
MDTIENDLRNKIEHAFDLKQIFDIFSTFVTAMKSQDEKIKQLEIALTASNNKFNDLSDSVKTIEYNIQGFEIVD